MGTGLLGTGFAVRTGDASCLDGTEGIPFVGTDFLSTGLAMRTGVASCLDGNEVMLSVETALFYSI